MTGGAGFDTDDEEPPTDGRGPWWGLLAVGVGAGLVLAMLALIKGCNGGYG